MQLSDNITNSEILLLYVQEFNHLDPGTKEHYGGHPLSKRVYRAIHNKDTGSYRILYNQGERPVALSLPELASSTDYWNYHLIELTTKNIVDYDISEEDLDKILGWSDNKDIKKILTEGRVLAATDESDFMSALATKLIKAVEEDDLTVFKDLKEYSPGFAEAVEDLAAYLMHGGQLSIENMNLSSDDIFGPGINIGGANQAIYKYTNDHRRDPKDLLVAIEHLLAEYVRIT